MVCRWHAFAVPPGTAAAEIADRPAGRRFRREHGRRAKRRAGRDYRLRWV